MDMKGNPKQQQQQQQQQQNSNNNRNSRKLKKSGIIDMNSKLTRVRVSRSIRLS
jgi:hypothetical protein